MNARNRDDMVQAFQIAFDEWERRHRLQEYVMGGGGYTGALKDRGTYFASLLDELAPPDKPWADIGPGAQAEP